MLTRNILQSGLPSGVTKATSSINSWGQIRCYHSDLRVPLSAEAYRRKNFKNTAVATTDNYERAQAFSYTVSGALCAFSLIAAKAVVYASVSQWSMSKDALALAKIEIKLNDIPMGKCAVFKWRGKPLFVRHRTAQEISREESVDMATLRDPQRDSERATNPEWLVVIGVCTHLGCVPIANMGDYGGWYCPCHGSHYDSAGRIRKGPAPLNLEIPAYNFMDDDILIVG